MVHCRTMMHIIRQYWVHSHFAAVLTVATCLLTPLSVKASTPLSDEIPVITCSMQPLSSMLENTFVVADQRRQPEVAYRRTLTRFIQQHYTKLGHDIAIMRGNYLDSLHTLLGTTPTARQHCNQLFKDRLLNTTGSNGFAQAMLSLRFTLENNAETARTFPTHD